MLQSAERTECLHGSVLERGRTVDYASGRTKQDERTQHEKNYEEQPV